MNSKSLLILVVILLSVSACSTMSITFDFNPEVDFKQYRSYQWKDGIGISWNKDGSTLSYDQNIVHSAANALLSEKGYVILISGEPDFYIYPHVNVKDVIITTKWGYFYGSSWLPSTGNIDQSFYESNNLFLDIVDAKSKQLIWRGAVSEVDPDNLTKEEITKTVQKALVELMEDFPPED